MVIDNLYFKKNTFEAKYKNTNLNNVLKLNAFKTKNNIAKWMS